MASSSRHEAQSSGQPERNGARPKMHAVIMAGGSGTRFWPFSRRSLPKQFLPLGGEKSLLRETFERLAELVTADRVWVITNRDHVERVLSELPEVPAAQVIGEPVGRNTAPCIGLAARRIARRDSAASILVCPADHVIRPAAKFRQTVEAAADVLSRLDQADDPLTLTFGIKPRYAATGFGYIERGEELLTGELGAEPGDARAFSVAKFHEKPELEAAEKYVAGGSFYWNSGIFLWDVAGVSRLIERHLPELASRLGELERASTDDVAFATAMETHFPTLPSVSIDHGVLEKTKRVSVIEAAFEWDDLGSWAAIDRYAPRDANDNSVMGRHLGVASHRCIIVGQKRLIATIGLEDVVVVETDDAVLVCRRDQTERVKDVVERLGRQGEDDLL